MLSTIRTSAALAAVCLLVVSCRTREPEPYVPEWYPGPLEVVVPAPEGSPAAVASPCGQACSNLYRLGCVEGRPSGTSCYTACIRMAALQRIPAACWARANSVDELRACGRVRCLQ